ncbi:MAG: hypothetical protein ACI9KE_001539 [Polyangiales bacterium]|jgi:hypothetical protein
MPMLSALVLVLVSLACGASQAEPESNYSAFVGTENICGSRAAYDGASAWSRQLVDRVIPANRVHRKRAEELVQRRGLTRANAKGSSQ